MNTEFARKNEEKDYKLFADFSSTLKLKQIGRTKEMSPTDASGYTQDNQYVNIELKSRNLDINKYDSLFIEGHKYASLMKGIYVGKIPLYINFMKNDIIAVYNLKKLKEEPRQEHKRVWSETYQAFEHDLKLYLPIKEAWIYKKENDKYKLIQKGW